jgi:hypothetical protein
VFNASSFPLVATTIAASTWISKKMTRRKMTAKRKNYEEESRNHEETSQKKLHSTAPHPESFNLWVTRHISPTATGSALLSLHPSLCKCGSAGTSTDP